MDEPMNAYGSHIPILEKLFQFNNIMSVIETGMGDFSTSFFVSHGCGLVSIEMQNLQWFQEVSAKHAGNAEFLCMLDKDQAVNYVAASSFVDLVFVDGHHYSRFDQVMAGMRTARYVVAHDSEAMIYRWDRVALPAGWVWVDVEEFGPNPWTAVMMRRGDLAVNEEWLKDWKYTAYDSLKEKKYVHLHIQDDI